MVDGDLVLYETAAICLHLVDTNPQAGLAPAIGSPARAHFYKWLIWMTNTLQATLIVYFYPERWADSPDAIAQVRAHAEASVGRMLDQLDSELGRHGQPWLLGDRFTALDPYALMLGRWTRGGSKSPSGYPHDHASPALVVAIAVAPHDSISRALPASHAFASRGNCPGAWSSRNVFACVVDA